MRIVQSTLRVGLILLATSLAGAALAQAPPAAPEVTVGAGLKRLLFDWDPVPGATHYQLLDSSAASDIRRQIWGSVVTFPPMLS